MTFSGPAQVHSNAGTTTLKPKRKTTASSEVSSRGLTVQRRSENTGVKEEEAQNQGLDLETAAAHQCRSSMGPKNRAQCGRSTTTPSTLLSLSTHLLRRGTCSDKATEGKGGSVRVSWCCCCWVNISRLQGKYGTKDDDYFDSKQGSCFRNNVSMEMFVLKPLRKQLGKKTFRFS